jgi:hypothetical protein
VRTLDRPLPPITLDPGAFAAWPVRPVVAVESVGAPAYVWDGATVWDTPGAVWDASFAAPTFVDASCDLTGCEITFDPPDAAGVFPAGHLIVTLDNRSGRWARYNADGTPTDYGAGARVWVWASDRAAGAWWLFAGRAARWDERAGDVIEIEAFDYLSDLAQPVGTFTPGVAGELPGARLNAVTAFGPPISRTRFDTGTVTLTRQATKRAPLEEMEVIAASDGGVLYCDADGTVVFEDRLWRVGRDDQTVVPTVGTNVCTAPIVVWDPVLSSTDTALASTVTLENVAGLKSTATRGPATPYVYADTDHQWTTQLEGDTLAAALVAQMWQPRLGLDTADLYLTDPARNYWQAVDWRRLDRVRVLHDSRTPTGTARVDIEALIVTLEHAFTPDGWVMTFGTGRALAYYATEAWDEGAVWDGGAVWGYS